MGCWGTGLYANDTAADLKASFKEWARLPVDAEGLRNMAVENSHAASDPDAEGHANFWLVLADLFHGYGLEDEETFARARQMIDEGIDLRINRELDMAPSDLKKRAAVLEKLKVKWTRPNPKPRPRRIFKKPPRLISAPGDVWIYPTYRGNAMFRGWNSPSKAKPDAWNAFVVASATLHLGYFPHYFIVRLHVFTRDRPTLEVCSRAPLGTRAVPEEFGAEAVAEMPEPRWRHSAGWVQILMARKLLAEIRAEKIGGLEIDGDRLRSIFHLSEIGDWETGNSALSPTNRGGMPDYRPVPMDERLCDFLVSGSI